MNCQLSFGIETPRKSGGKDFDKSARHYPEARKHIVKLFAEDQADHLTKERTLPKPTAIYGMHLAKSATRKALTISFGPF